MFGFKFDLRRIFNWCLEYRFIFEDWIWDVFGLCFDFSLILELCFDFGYLSLLFVSEIKFVFFVLD